MSNQPNERGLTKEMKFKLRLKEINVRAHKLGSRRVVNMTVEELAMTLEQYLAHKQEVTDLIAKEKSKDKDSKESGEEDSNTDE